MLRAASSTAEVLNFAVQRLVVLGFARVRIWLVDWDTQEVYGGKSSHIPDREFARLRADLAVKKSSEYFRKALSTKRPFLNETNALLHKMGDPYADRPTVEFPLLCGNRLLGCIAADNYPGPTELDLTKLNRQVMPLINHLALTLYRVQSEEKLRRNNEELEKKVAAATNALATQNAELYRLAHFDELTGLPNRRNFTAKLAAEVAAANPARPLSLAFIDLDFLKQINDTRGHLAGDRALKKLAAALQTFFPGKYSARFAGDEFVVLLPGCSGTAACQKMEKFRQKLAGETKIELSIGVATYPDRGLTNAEDLLRAADDAVYHAKHTGRARTACYGLLRDEIVATVAHKKALQKIEARGEVTDYVTKLETLDEITEHLQAARTNSEVLQKVLHTFRVKLGFRGVRLYLVDPADPAWLVCQIASGLLKKEFLALRLPSGRGRSIAGEAFSTGKVVNVPDVNTYPTAFPGLVERLKKLGLRGTVCVPLIARGQTIGVLAADYDPTTLKITPRQHRYFAAVGSHVALALEQTRLMAEVTNFNHELEGRVTTATAQLAEYAQSLEQKIADNKILRDKERQSHFEIISALVVSIEAKDIYTRGHSARVANFAEILGRAVGLAGERLANLRYGALLHDLGKLSIDQNILNKRTALTDDEVAQLRQHPVIGARILRSLHFLRPVAEFVEHHHERWDGHGYPDALAGEAIPLEGRIIAIADAYDAMVSRRSYGAVLPHATAIRGLTADAGTHFDPALVAAFARAMRRKNAHGHKFR